mmetsp:Transcript_5270/g.6037  ORF Transcript_5270/g.6037 Transcript_5270/m.6037 type:complete len:88 (+) Transcript_5270:175-438(+)
MLSKSTTKEIDFVNKLNKEAIFEFISTRPDVCRPRVDHVRIAPRSTKRIEFLFPAQRSKGKADCLVFINDEEYNFYETYRFKVSYIA